MLITLLVYVMVFGVIAYIITLLPLPEPWRGIALVLLLLIAMLAFLSVLGVIPDTPLLRVR